MTSPNALEVRTKDGVKFGKELREKEFLFQKGYLNLNHGKWWSFICSIESLLVGDDSPRFTCMHFDFHFSGSQVFPKHH
jgi:hypothetical protein